jgi:acyl dehydratase
MHLGKVLARHFPLIEHTLTPRDCMLYALGIGVGARTEAASDLQFCYEEGLKVFPAMANVIAHPGPWVKDPELGINWIKLLHGEQSFIIHRPLRPDQTYTGSYKVRDVIDKGPSKGALLYLEKQLRENGSDTLVSTVSATYFLRADGGCGGTLAEAPLPHAIPERQPDSSLALNTLPQAALIYRLSGDHNPIHIDPTIARKAGFERPILHGLCTMGVATRAILQAYCNDEPERLKEMSVRFSAPMFPGETVVTEFWREGRTISFRARVAERDATVLNNGYAVLAD